MSDLKHQSAAQLNDTITRTAAHRERLLADAGALEKEATRLTDLAALKRKTYHALGHREAWARLYLARKEVAA